MRLPRTLMGLLYITAGALHFVLTRTYTGIMPDYLPAHRELVLISGAAEIAGGLGILIPQTRRPAAWGLILLLIAVMPANIWMAQHPERYSSIPLWAIYLRLPLQLPLIWWAYLYTRRENQLKATADSPTLSELIGNVAAAEIELDIEPRLNNEPRPIDFD